MAVLSAFAPAFAAPAAADSPNVLMVLTDDQPARGTMQAMPVTKAWFETYGTEFTNAYATTPLCCPSRASIFSGRYAHNHGQFSNRGETKLDPQTSVARYLDEAGYRTGIVGKYLNTWWPTDAPPDFDDYRIFPGGYHETFWNLNGKLRIVKEYSTNFIRKQGVNFIRRAEADDATPWFLHVAPVAPHSPYTAAAKHAAADVGPFPENPATEEEDISDKPLFLRDLIAKSSPPAPEEVRAQQLRTLISVDEMMAVLLANLAWAEELDNTLIFFLSDNGYHWGEHQIPPIKSLPYPEASRIPMMASWPGHLPQGAVDSRMVANIDIAPTIIEAAGLAADQPPMDGRSLLDPSWARERLLLEFFGQPRKIPAWAGLITPTTQYTQYGAMGKYPSTFEYYAIEDDPWRLENLLGNGSPDDDPPIETILELSKQLGEDLACSGASCP